MNNARVTSLQRLRAKRRLNGRVLTLQLLADILMVDISQVSRWERFERDVPEKYRQSYASVLGVKHSRLAALIADGRQQFRDSHAA